MISAKGVLLRVLRLRPNHRRRGLTGLAQKRLARSGEGVEEEEARVDECYRGGLAVPRSSTRRN